MGIDYFLLEEVVYLVASYLAVLSDDCMLDDDYRHIMPEIRDKCLRILDKEDAEGRVISSHITEIPVAKAVERVAQHWDLPITVRDGDFSIDFSPEVVCKGLCSQLEKQYCGFQILDSLCGEQANNFWLIARNIPCECINMFNYIRAGSAREDILRMVLFYDLVRIFYSPDDIRKFVDALQQSSHAEKLEHSKDVILRKYYEVDDCIRSTFLQKYYELNSCMRSLID